MFGQGRVRPVALALLAGLAISHTTGAKVDLDDGHGSHSHGGAVRHDGGAWWESEFTCQHDVAPAWALDEPPVRTRGSFDEATGRNLLNYPPHRLVDFRHMTLAITIADMNRASWEARQTLFLSAIASPVSSLSLNVGPKPSMEIRRVMLMREGIGAREVSHKHEGESLSMTFDPPLMPGGEADLVVEYTLWNPREGITWTPEAPLWPGRPAQLHSQGQPESNHYWFPCHDFPNERLTTELIVTVPPGYVVCSNGYLAEKRRASESDGGGEVFHWLQDKPHVNYLVTLVVGKFDVVDVASGGSVPMPVYAPLGRGGDVQRTYGRTPRMTALFERLIDEPYPWDKYAQAVVWNFGSGGMENTSATTMYDTAVLDERSLLDGDLEGLISHELAHQWFGDLLTCNSWEHIWLNEGFATYFTHLWFEERDGKDAYLSALWGTYQGLANNDKADAPYQPAMCSKEYAHPWEVFRRASNPYSKGASVLHMLRRKVGDQLFFDALKLYVERHKFKAVETDDLRYAFEEVSGLSLERFFRQWCYKPGTPSADVVLTWDSASSSLRATLTQTQPIDGYNPAFFYTLPIWVKLPSGETRTLELEVDGKETSASFTLPAEPSMVAVDPELHVLGHFRVDAWNWASNWRDLLTQGPTIAAKLQAVAAIRAMGVEKITSDAAMALSALARDTREHFSLPAAAAEAIFEVGTPDLLLGLATSQPQDARVRKAVIEQIPGGYERIKNQYGDSSSRVLESLRSAAEGDPSYGVRGAALRAYAKLAGADAKPVVLDALKVESQHDQIRQAAIDGLASINDADALEQAIRSTSPASYPRTRPSAVNAVATLAAHNPDLAFETLKGLLDDAHDRTARAAGDAMVRLNDPRSVGAIESFIERTNRPAAKQIAERWLRDLREQLSN